MLDSHTPIHVFKIGFVTGVRYRDEILEHYGLRGACGPEFSSMADNAGPHIGLLVYEFLERCSEEGNCNPQLSFENHPGHENSVTERVGPIVAKSGKLPYFITLRGRYSYNLVALHFKYDQARRRFVEWAQNEIAVVPDFHKRILFSDEAHFWLNGYVNKQNCRIWSEANPRVYVETPLHPEKLTVWCTLWAVGIIGPYFFKNDEGHNVTVNGDRYRSMITNFFIPELNKHDV
ncbi:putative DD41D transposase [Trichonephila clavipes]|nr:putative DD41D transposase [Trichonephila clavipes]